MGFMSKNPRFETEIFTDQGATSISNAPTGTNRIINRAGIFYSQDTSGVETPLSAGGLTSPVSVQNYSFTAAAAASALTITLKNAAGATPSSSSPASFAFRNATSATGTYSIVSAVAATSLVIASGATLGLPASDNCYFYVYALNNAGTLEIGVSAQKFDDGSIQSSTTMSGSSTSATTLYSTTGRSNVPIRLIGRMQINEATIGTWTLSPLEIALGDKFLTGYTPTILDDVTATKLGTKIYVHGTNYNGGNAPTVTLSTGGGSLTSVNQASFIPYQMQDGTWRLRFNVDVLLTTVARTGTTLAINGITFGNNGLTGQAVTATAVNSAFKLAYALAGNSANTLIMVFDSVNTNEIHFSGDVALTSKPTWAY